MSENKDGNGNEEKPSSQEDTDKISVTAVKTNSTTDSTTNEDLSKRTLEYIPGEKKNLLKIGASKMKSFFIFMITHLTLEQHQLFRIRILILSVVMCMFLVVLPFRCVFLMTDDDSNIFIWFDVFMDVILYLDMMLKALTPFENTLTQKKESNYLKTFIYYIKSWHFYADVVTLLPFDWIIIILRLIMPDNAILINLFSLSNAVFRLNRLLILIRYTFYFKVGENFFVSFRLNPIFIRLFKLFVICGFVAHWVSCMFFMLCIIEGKQISIQWTRSLNLLEPETTWDYKYSFSLYWSILTLIGYGGLMPSSDIEIIFSIIVVAVGVGFYATVIGAVGSLMLNMDNVEASFREKMERINKYIENKQLQPQLKESILTYYKYIWHVKKGLNEEEILKDVPEFLRMEVSKSLNQNIIEKVPIFKDASNAFISEIVMRLTSRVALPSSYIIMQGETGKEMFFLKQGSVDVIVGDNLVVHNFKPGDFFGEIALVKNVKRTASCIARDFCDLFVLTKSDFELIMSNFKEEAKKIYEKAEKNEKDTKKKKEKKMKKKRKRKSPLPMKKNGIFSPNSKLINIEEKDKNQKSE